MYCCCLQKDVNKLKNIQNEPKSYLSTGIIGKQVCRFRISHLYISNSQFQNTKPIK